MQLGPPKIPEGMQKKKLKTKGCSPDLGLLSPESQVCVWGQILQLEEKTLLPMSATEGQAYNSVIFI